MSADQHPMIRELFSNLKTTLNERLDLITQIINTIEKPKIPLYDNVFVKRIERLEHQQPPPQTSSFMEERIAALEEQLASTCSELEEVKALLAKKTAVLREPISLSEPILPEEEASLIIEEEEEEEGEEEGLELEEFPYKGTVYYKDANNNVYSTDDDGDVITEPIAHWTGTKLVRI